jgi:hypothetical protein
MRQAFNFIVLISFFAPGYVRGSEYITAWAKAKSKYDMAVHQAEMSGKPMTPAQMNELANNLGKDVTAAYANEVATSYIKRDKLIREYLKSRSGILNKKGISPLASTPKKGKGGKDLVDEIKEDTSGREHGHRISKRAASDPNLAALRNGPNTVAEPGHAEKVTFKDDGKSKAPKKNPFKDQGGDTGGGEDVTFVEPKGTKHKKKADVAPDAKSNEGGAEDVKFNGPPPTAAGNPAKK